MSTASDAARAYARANSDKFLDELKAMLRIPSLSGDPAHAGDVRRMAEWLAEHMAGLGLDRVEVMETAGHPVVYGEWLGAGPDKPTVLVYGHYDVVPAELADGWDSDPFEPVVRMARSTRAAPPTTRASSSSTSRRWSPISRPTARPRSTSSS
jgi:acetylornithine deacetylase/succinyl-diaminopimelate desuccinylase-like protein